MIYVISALLLALLVFVIKAFPIKHIIEIKKEEPTEVKLKDEE